MGYRSLPDYMKEKRPRGEQHAAFVVLRKLSGPQPMEHLQILFTVERVKRQAWRVFLWMPWVELLLRKLIRLAGVSFA